MYYQGYRPPPQPPVQPNRPTRWPNGNRYNNRRRKRHPVILLVSILAVVVIALTVAGIYGMKYMNLVNEVKAVDGVYLQNIYVDGIHLGGMTAQEAIDAVYASVDARQNDWQLTLTYQGITLGTLSYSDMGITTDRTAVYNLLLDAYRLGHEGTLQERKQDIETLKTTPYKVFTTQSAMTDEYLNKMLADIQVQFAQEPQDAYLVYFEPNQKDPFGIQSEQNGRYLDIEPIRTQIMQMAADGTSGSLELQPEPLYPAVTKDDVRSRLTLIAEAITPISTSSAEARNQNIRIAFDKINGTVLEPGQQFSFNGTVGARTLENGFQYAIEYANGDSVVGVGGGVCQASTTVYLAALLSNQKIIKREPHSDEVSYTTFGQDATVYYTRDRKIDFVFENNTDGNLYITAHVESAGKNRLQCVVRFYGPSLGPGVEYKLRTETVEEIPAPLEIEYRKDTKGDYVTYKDEEYEFRKARAGYVNDTYLQRWEDGKLVSETFISRDTCKARSEVIYVGVKNRDE